VVEIKKKVGCDKGTIYPCPETKKKGNAALITSTKRRRKSGTEVGQDNLHIEKKRTHLTRGRDITSNLPEKKRKF